MSREDIAYEDSIKRFHQAAIDSTTRNVAKLVEAGVTEHSAATAVLFGAVGAAIEIVGEPATHDILTRFLHEMRERHDA